MTAATTAPISAFICGVEGVQLTGSEREFLSTHRPFGVILFARNCERPDQVKALVDDIKQALNHPLAVILIDQEGGRVARLKPPHWRAYPPAARFAAFDDAAAAERLTYLNARLIAHDLSALGINVNCAPLADIPVTGSHDIIGDRAFGTTVSQVTRLARAQANGLHDGGVISILKHIPGHGRARADSHVALPVVETSKPKLEVTDFAPFKALNDLPMAMTAHVLYSAIDAERVATLSPTMIRLIREEIGFDGVLMSDDLSMKALSGTIGDLARGVWQAGCDIVLHCNGNMDEMQAISEVAVPLAGTSLERCERALASVTSQSTLNESEMLAEIERLMPALYAA
jgi:beta-N-acetylhexosaminidase